MYITNDLNYFRVKVFMRFLKAILFLFFLSSCYKSDLDAANAENESLRIQVSALTAQLNSLNIQLNSLNAEIQSLKNLLSASETEIDGLEDLVQSYQIELMALQETLLGAETLDDELFSYLSSNVEVLQFVLGRVTTIATQYSDFSGSEEQKAFELNSLTQDLNSFVQKYSELKGDSQSIKISLLKHIKAEQLLEGVEVFEWGDESVPSTLETDCNWVNLLSDSFKQTLVSFHPDTNTLLMTHQAPLVNRHIRGSSNNNITFLLNHFGSPKKIFFVSPRPISEHTDVIDALKLKGHSVDFLRLDATSYTLQQFPQLSSENLSRYQGLLFDDNINRPSKEILDNLSAFASNKLKPSLFSTIGWVWVSYRSTYDREPLPLNDVIEPLGAKFLVWEQSTAFAVQTSTAIYPQTYQNREVCD